MKKKLMMVAVLFGALSLGACVDDNESQSVTAVRNAKAEQLKAVAAMYNAQAEADLIRANAEKALKDAQAAYQQALAEAELASAEHQKELTEQAKQRFAVEIERTKAEAERAIAAAKLQAAKDEQALLELADAHVRELYDEYKWALNGIIELQKSKIRLTTSISQAEADLVPLQTQKEYEIAYYQQLIDMEEYKITLYNESKGADLVELKKAAEKARQAAEAADNARNKAQAADAKAFNAYDVEARRFDPDRHNDVTKPINTVVAAKELKEDFGWVFTDSLKKFPYLWEEVRYYKLDASRVEGMKQELERIVKYLSEHVGTDKDDATKWSLYGQLANVEKQKADALTANPNADVTDYENRIAQLKAEIATRKEELKKAEARVPRFNSLIASFAGDDLKAYDEAFAELIKLAEAYEKAHVPYLEAQTAATKAWSEWEVAQSLIGEEHYDVERYINECKERITSHQNMQLRYKNNVTNKETLIAQYKFELEIVEGEIAAQQAIIDNLKKLIDAAIAEQE